MVKGERKNTITPRQMAFISNYCNVDSESYSNAYQSALKAGYSIHLARKIMAILPTKIQERITDELEPEKIKTRVIENLNWLILTLKDATQRKRLGISVDNCIKSLELLGKWQKLFTDRVEVSGGITVTGALPGHSGYREATGRTILQGNIPAETIDV